MSIAPLRDGDAEPLAELHAHPRRVLLVGNYGSVNLGDELLLRVIGGWVREAGGEPVAVSVRPAHTERVHGMRAVYYADASAIARAMGEADLLVLGGGGLLQDYNTLHEDEFERFPAFEATQFAQYALLATTLGVPYAAIAQGVGPLRGASARRIVRHVFASANAASLRDEASAALVRATGCEKPWPVAPDAAWAWSASVEPVAPSSVDGRLAGGKVLAMLLREWPYDPQWEDRFVAAFGGALPNGWGCLWIDFHRDPDASSGATSAIAERLRQRLGGVHAMWQGSELDEAYGLLAGCDAVLAMRLHGALLAQVARRPTAVIEYDDKVASLAADLGMPSRQRVPLDAIAERLVPAIRTLCGLGPEPAFVVDAAGIADRAERALLHRSILWQAMADAPAPLAAPPARQRWIAQWGREAGQPAAGFIEALETRLHRVLDQQHRATEALDRARGDLLRERDQRARLAAALEAEIEARQAALVDAGHWREQYGRIEHSHSYRMMAPARRLAGAWRSWRNRGGGSESS